MTRTFIAALLAFLVLFPANGLFHAVLAAPFFDAWLQGLGQAIHPMSASHPVPVALLDALLALTTAGYARVLKGGLLKGAIIGATLNLLTAMSWNLANMATLSSWPLRVLLLDAPWHTGLGSISGIVAMLVIRDRKKSIAAQ